MSTTNPANWTLGELNVMKTLSLSSVLTSTESKWWTVKQTANHLTGDNSRSPFLFSGSCFNGASTDQLPVWMSQSSNLTRCKLYVADRAAQLMQ